MPIEIKELSIQVTVQDTNKAAAAGGGQSAQLKEDIIEECIEKVMELLNHKYQNR